MTNRRPSRRAFVAFHLALGLTLLAMSVAAAVSTGTTASHVSVLGSLESLGAVLAAA